MSRPGSVSVSVDQLRPGVVCSHSIDDEGGILLLGSGTRITEQVIAGLVDRDVKTIDIHPSDLAAMTGGKVGGPRPVRKNGREVGFSGVWEENISLKELLVDRFEEPFNEKRTEVLQRGLLGAKARFDQLERMIVDREIHSIDSIATISDAYARAILDDYDQTVGVMGAAEAEHDISRRSVQMAVLGMAIGAELGFDGPTTLEIGLAGLLHDVGLLVMDPKFRDPSNSMSPAERWEYEKHPLVAKECLENLRDIPVSVQLAIQQVHEQYDGSGFPRALRGPRIHIYARILNVVDAYLHLISPASNRCGILPHDALGLMLHHAGRGIFDPKVIRAFLKTETMFPLGSLVELQSGAPATVIRRKSDDYAKPVLVNQDGERLDQTDPENTILRPLASCNLPQMRIPISQMPSIQWNLAENRLLV
ncbi:Cyclic di-GMP phosphodiesterase response regulator RpfG [Planctomycetes bacterium CA13]|uniref:Cyclic di-GMP phosphodiesterase response regulator RpfG n=1 Tax=Novipirellula herctigrandis TaxID=2527986 RepID=A0A5C5YN15_9BACT|nr:Cyclic di-GMP phosphodiesterase response regulator RpfG [Planctomycetes bacterium CA13]